MTEITVDAGGLAPADRKLALLALLLRDLRPFWPKLVRLFVSWETRQFQTEGRFFGDGWEALSPAYAAWKAQHYPGKPILSRGGHPGTTLRQSATTPRRVASPLMLELRIEPYDNDGREIDPAWFQDGTARMPARPLLAETLPVVAAREVEQAGEEYARSIVSRLGLG